MTERPEEVLKSGGEIRNAVAQASEDHYEEKGNMEVLWHGKKRRSVVGVPMKNDARTCKHPRVSPGFQHTADAALELYFIRKNGKKAYSIQPIRQAIPKWQNLVSFPTVVSARENYSIKIGRLKR